jgi:alpha(1,3/1,4) fucosyltransferase
MKIGFLDMGSWFNVKNNFFINALKHNFENVEVVEPKEADTLIFSVFGQENRKLRYKFKKRVFYSGEPWDTNKYNFDYSLTYEPKTEKNFQLPVWMFYIDWFNLNEPDNVNNWHIPQNYLNLANPFIKKPKIKFCSFVFSRISDQRKNIVDVLNNINKVDSYGNLWGETPKNKSLKNGQYYKIDTISDYKFNIAFENIVKKGYVTEKLLQARIAGCIPIYSGDKSVYEVFDPDGFLNVTGMPNEQIYDEVQNINNNNVIYKSMINQKIFINEPTMEDVYSSFYKIFS